MPAPRAILILSLSFSSRDILFLNEFHISSLFLTRRFLFPLLEDTSILVQNKKKINSWNMHVRIYDDWAITTNYIYIYIFLLRIE